MVQPAALVMENYEEYNPEAGNWNNGTGGNRTTEGVKEAEHKNRPELRSSMKGANIMKKRGIDRRDFLKYAATVAGGVLVGGGIPLEKMASGRTKSTLADYGERPMDPKEVDARATLESFFERNREKVFFSRQVEVQHEDRFFHWITNRAIRDLVEEGAIRGETRTLRNSGTIHLLWHRSYRFHKRSARRLVELVETYADPNIGAVLGLHGEMMVLAGFAKSQFVMRAQKAREFGGKVWEASEHDLDFIFERDSVVYGVEVKNTLGYMDYEEFSIKIRMCRFLGLRPIFVVRMIPKTWIKELVDNGGYGMILKYQLYPWTHRELASRVAQELGLPVDSPRALATSSYSVVGNGTGGSGGVYSSREGTIERFLRWHKKNV
jgi:hypothetical protein